MRLAALAAFAASIAFGFLPGTAAAGDYDHDRHDRRDDNIQLGERPFFLVQGMDPGPLKSRLLKC